MDNNYTHISLVVDRSGSMTDVKDDAQKGIDALLTDQFALDGKLTVTLTQFDDKIDTVKRLAKRKFKYELKPRGWTALLDAVGQEITKTGEDLAALPEDKRPAKVLFVVVTDGYENASREYNTESIKALVDTQKNDYNWEFQFIGADQAAWAGAQLGMASTQYVGSAIGTQTMYAGLNNATTAYRSSNAAFAMAAVLDEEEE
jgi:hypothetical protein